MKYLFPPIWRMAVSELLARNLSQQFYCRVPNLSFFFPSHIVFLLLFFLLFLPRPFYWRASARRTSDTVERIRINLYSGTDLYFKMLHWTLFMWRGLKPIFISAWRPAHTLSFIFFHFPSFAVFALFCYTSLVEVNRCVIRPVSDSPRRVRSWIIPKRPTVSVLALWHNSRYDGISCFKTCLRRIYCFETNGLCFNTMGSTINQITK